MHKLIRRGLYGSLLAGGLILLGAGVASAADNQTSGRHGLLSGNQVIAPVTAPITAVGNAISVIGDSSATTNAAPAAAPAASSASAASATTSGRRGIGSGNQVIAPVRVPVTVSGNAVSGVGDSSVTGTGVQAAPSQPASQTGSATTSGRRGVLSGNQVIIPINAPITVTGNAISVIGDSSVVNAAPAPSGSAGGSTGGSTVGSPVTSGDRGLLSGNQVIAPVNLPVLVGGNAVSGIGDSSVVGSGPGSAGSTGGSTVGSPVTSGDNGLGSGNQVVAPINAPVTATGNAISVIGDSSVVGTGTGGTGGSSGGTTPGGSPITSGDGGIGSGNQILIPINAPITIGGNAVSVIGDSTVTNPPGATTPEEPPVDLPTPVPGDTPPGDGSGSGSGSGSDGSGAGSDAASAVPALALTGSSTLLPLGIALLLLLFGALLVGLSSTRRKVALRA